MALQKVEGGTKITQLSDDVIEVIEGGVASKILGVVMCVGGLVLMSSADYRFFDMTCLLGVALVVIGAAVATQRFRMVLDRRRGTWTCSGSVFFVLALKSSGALADVGDVRISRRTVDYSGERRGRLVTTYPVTVEAVKQGGGNIELRFGKYWDSIEQARTVAIPLAEFLGRKIQDESHNKA